MRFDRLPFGKARTHNVSIRSKYEIYVKNYRDACGLFVTENKRFRFDFDQHIGIEQALDFDH